MDIAHLLDAFPLAPDIEIIKPRLPDMLRSRFPQLSLLPGAAFPPAPEQMLCEALFDGLHHHGRVADLWLADEQVEVLGHDHVGEHNEPVLFTTFFEDALEQIPPYPACPAKVGRR